MPGSPLLKKKMFSVILTPSTRLSNKYAIEGARPVFRTTVLCSSLASSYPTASAIHPFPLLNPPIFDQYISWISHPRLLWNHNRMGGLVWVHPPSVDDIPTMMPGTCWKVVFVISASRTPWSHTLVIAISWLLPIAMLKLPSKIRPSTLILSPDFHSSGCRLR